MTMNVQKTSDIRENTYIVLFCVKIFFTIDWGFSTIVKGFFAESIPFQEL